MYKSQLTHRHWLPISLGHNPRLPRVYPPSWATTQGMSFQATTQGMLQQISTLKPSSKAFKINSTSFKGLQPSYPSIHFFYCSPPYSTPFYDILKLILVAMSDNSPLQLQATTCSPHTGIIQLQTTIYNTEWSSLIQTTICIHHETTSFTDYNHEEQSSEPSVLTTTSTLTPEFQCHQAPT